MCCLFGDPKPEANEALSANYTNSLGDGKLNLVDSVIKFSYYREEVGGMDHDSLLLKKAAMARTGDVGSFEDFYILSVSEVYGRIQSLQLTEQDSENLLMEVYSNLYQNLHRLPLTREELNTRFEDEIYHGMAKLFGKEPEAASAPISPEEYPRVDEEKACRLWIKLAARCRIGRIPEKAESAWKSWLVSLGYICMVILLLLATILVVWLIWSYATRL